MEQRVRARRIARVDIDQCVACGCCVKVCPRGAISVWKGCFAEVDAGRCIGCGKCVPACPAAIIEMEETER